MSFVVHCNGDRIGAGVPLVHVEFPMWCVVTPYKLVYQQLHHFK